MNKKNRLKRIEENLKDHTYRLIGQGDRCEIWRCNTKGSSFYAFDICITDYGISIMGDIDSLVFRVGYAYGIDFLAKDDVEYYIYSKLEEDYKIKEIDESKCMRLALKCLVPKFIDKLETNFIPNIPKWLYDNQTEDYIKKFEEYIAKLYYDNFEISEDDFDYIDDLHNFLNGIYEHNENEIYTVDQMWNHFYQCELMTFSDLDYSELNKIPDSILDRLYMVNYMAKKIKDFKNENNNSK